MTESETRVAVGVIEMKKSKIREYFRHIQKDHVAAGHARMLNEALQELADLEKESVRLDKLFSHPDCPMWKREQIDSWIDADT